MAQIYPAFTKNLITFCDTADVVQYLRDLANELENGTRELDGATWLGVRAEDEVRTPSARITKREGITELSKLTFTMTSAVKGEDA